MSAGSIGSSRGDGFAALRDLAVALAEAGDFLQAAQRFRDALAAASRLPGPPADAVAAAAATTGAGGAAAAGPPGAPPAFGGLAAGAGAARGPGLGLGCGHSHSRGHGQGHGQAAASQLAADDGPRRELAAAHDMLAQCLMQLAIEEVEGGGGAAAAAGRGRGLELAGGRCEGGPGEREEGEAAVEMEAAREADLWEEALRSSAEACRLLPRWVPARLTYARCLRNCGFLDEALRELNGAMQILDANRAAIRAGSSEPSTDAAVAAGATSAGSAGLEAEANATAKAGAALGAAAEDSLQLDPKWDAAKHPAPEFGLPDLALEAEVADELSEVSELWQQRLARDVGLPGLRIRQDAGVLGEGPGRRVWECGVLLAAYLVQQQQQQAARPPPQDSHDGGAKAHEGSVTGAIGTAAIDLEGARVLELGCGSGLVGITAAACGARCVLTDLPPVLPAAAACAAANAGLIRAGGGSVAVRPLDWVQGSGGDGVEGSGEGAGVAAAWLRAGQGLWAAVEADDFDYFGRKPEVPREGEQAGKVNGAADSCLGRLPSAGQRPCWVLGADLVYSGVQVDALVGLLIALRWAAQHVGSTAGAIGVPASDMGDTAVDAALSSQQAVCVRAETTSAPSCSLLLAHKHRSEAVSRKLLSTLHAAGIELRKVEVAEDGKVRRFSGISSSVALYESKLW